MKVVTIANQKGGCGKTITAVNLAGALSGAGKKVLFIDLDPQAHATSALGADNKNPSETSFAIFEIFLKPSAKKGILHLAERKYENLWVIGSHLLLSTLENKLADKKDAILVISRAVASDELSEFDYVIIDTPPNLGFLTLNAVMAAQRLIVPLDISLFSMNGVSQIEKLLSISHDMGFKKPETNFLITMFDGRSNFAKNFLEKAKADFGKRLFRTIIRPNVKLREAALLGKAIFEHAPYANGAKDYIALAREIEPALEEHNLRNLVGCGTGSATYEVAEVADLSVPSIDLEVSFELVAPEAERVYVTGSFNRWALDDSYSMEKLADGSWVKKLRLGSGKHLYKFVIDGAWQEDPRNEFHESDMMGGKNSVVIVKGIKEKSIL